MNCFYSFRTDKKLKFHENVCKKKDFCELVVPSEKDHMLEFNHHMNSDKIPDIIYADIESLIKKIDGLALDQENLTATKIA